MKRNLNTKKMVMNALLLAIGAILHQITPALGLPMQPDFALAMLFIIMIINDNDYKTSLICAIITGVFTALTTKFPGGQLPNIIDKIVTVNVMFLVIIIINKISHLTKLNTKLEKNILVLLVFPKKLITELKAFFPVVTVLLNLSEKIFFIVCWRSSAIK